MQITEFIKQHKLPTNSRILAMQQVTDTHGDLDPSEYRVRCIELSGKGDELQDREARYTYLYLVQELLTHHFRNPEQPINRVVMYNIAERKAIDYINNNQYLFAEKETDAQTIDATTGKPKLKRGAKKAHVCALWAEHADKNMSRKEWIELLMEEVDMTKAGASTYYASLKNGTFGC